MSENYAENRENLELKLGFFNITDLNFTDRKGALKRPVCPKCGENSNSDCVRKE